MPDTVVSIDVVVRSTEAEQGIQQVKVAFQGISDEAKATSEKAKQSLSLLSEELGIKIPGEVQSLIAQLPGVGTALKAAFSATVVIAVIQVLADIAEKIETLSQQAEKHREAWTAIQSTMDQTTQHIASALDSQKAKYIEVTQGPLKAMQYELQHMHSIALSVFPGIASEMEKMAQQFTDEGGRWTEWGRANKEAGKDVKKTLADVQEAMDGAIKKDPSNLLAPFDAAIGVVQGKVAAIENEIKELPKSVSVSDEFGGVQEIAINEQQIAVLNQKKEALAQITSQLQAQKDLQQKIIETQNKEHALAEAKDRISANIQILSSQKSVEDAKRKLAEDTARFQLEQGKITADQEVEIEKTALNKEHDDAVQNIRKRRDLQLQDTSLTANQKRAIRKTADAEIEAADIKLQSDLLQVDSAANQRKTQDFLTQVQGEVVATKSGSIERVRVIQNALEQMKQMGMAGLAQYRQMEQAYNTAQHEYATKRLKDQLQLDEEEIHHTEQMSLTDLDIRRKNFENEILAHKKKNSEVIAAEQNFLDEELRIKVKALQQKLAAMAKDPDVSPLERKKIEDQILELEKQYALKRVSIKKDEVDRKKQLEQSFEQTLKSSFSSGIMGMLQGTESFAQAMQAIYSGLVQDVVNMLSEMLTEWISTHVLMKLFGLASTQETAEGAIAAERGKTYAAAFSDSAELGPAGLAAAPGVAAGAVTTMSVGARGAMAEGGQWNVPGLQFTLLHPQEMVLPANLASRMRDVVDGRITRNSDTGVTVVVNHSVNAVDAESFQQHIRRHGNMIGNEVARVLKKRGIAAK